MQGLDWLGVMGIVHGSAPAWLSPTTQAGPHLPQGPELQGSQFQNMEFWPFFESDFCLEIVYLCLSVSFCLFYLFKQT